MALLPAAGRGDENHRSGQAADASAAERYVLMGSSTTADGSSVYISDTATHRSLWIPVGGAAEGISVVSYDSARQEATVDAGGQRHTLTLRQSPAKAERASAASSSQGTKDEPDRRAGPVPEPARQSETAPTKAQAASAPVQGGSAVDPAEQRRDYRMLVSDLLDIGQKNRQAAQAASGQQGAPPQSP